MMGDSVTPGQRAAASRHAVPWVRARGPLPALRTGTMPYGILPCTPYDRWQAANDDIEAVFERALVDILNRLLPFWRDAVGRVACVRHRRPRSDDGRAARAPAVVGLVRRPVAHRGHLLVEPDAARLRHHRARRPLAGPHQRHRGRAAGSGVLRVQPAARQHDLCRCAVQLGRAARAVGTVVGGRAAHRRLPGRHPQRDGRPTAERAVHRRSRSDRCCTRSRGTWHCGPTSTRGSASW